LDESKLELSNFAKNLPSHEQKPKHEQNMKNGKATQT
jgi:hypothetical protein